MIKIKSKKLFDLLNYIYNFKKESINNIITYGSPLEQYIIYTKYIQVITQYASIVNW